MCRVQRFAFGVGNGEVLRSLWQILLIFSVAHEKVTQNNVIYIISTNKNKVVRVLNELKLNRRSLVRQRIFFSHFFAILVLIFFFYGLWFYDRSILFDICILYFVLIFVPNISTKNGYNVITLFFYNHITELLLETFQYGYNIYGKHMHLQTNNIL